MNIKISDFVLTLLKILDEYGIKEVENYIVFGVIKVLTTNFDEENKEFNIIDDFDNLINLRLVDILDKQPSKEDDTSNICYSFSEKKYSNFSADEELYNIIKPIIDEFFYYNILSLDDSSKAESNIKKRTRYNG